MKQGSIIWYEQYGSYYVLACCPKGKERIDYDGSNSFAKEMRDNATYVGK